ncbi:sugar ABC transporter substrate-binding protein [Streptomyces sp. CS113]|uniref:sugar ABC transporter substrate-binding protein n=1 Tax=Streptomyces sp. CS113 TaxID=1982761 RepID=UPI000B415ACD|nr:sugar ABC transporter substrate-binding protein [Streptomyces sp. CS113]OWA00778.1 sugar ABC transporter substrate-binding protein [Streptomyces sp. CS113]
MPTPPRCRRATHVPLLGIALLLSGCGLYQADSDTADHDPLTLGFVNGGDSQFHTCLQRSVEITAKNNFARLVTANSRQDPAMELSNIEDMIARKVDAIILQTVDTDALKRDMEKAGEADIPVFLTSVSANPDDILGAVVVDLKAVGRLDAQWIADDAAGRDVRVGVIAGAPGAASDLLTDGFTEALPANAEVVADQPGMFDADKAGKIATTMARAHPDLDYAFVANEQMAFAARKAFDAAGADKVRIVTVNGTDEALAALKDGRFSATVSNSAGNTGELAVSNTIALLRGRKATKIDHTPIRLVTKGDADTAPLYCPSDY